MRLLAYEDATTERALGVSADGRTFHSVASLAPDLPSNISGLLGLDGALGRLGSLLAAAGPGRPLSAVRLRPFLGRSNALWALALNFKTHIAETGLTTSLEYPHLFLRIASSYVGSGEALLAPPESVARAFDYEGELGVVIGKPGRHIPVERALDHVAGYTIVNEGSVREYQIHNRQFGLGKNFEASGSYGPWMMTADEFGDPAKQSLETRVNGVVRQRSGLDDLLVSVAETVAYLSQGYRLHPGDMIAMGTPGALPPAEDDVEGRDLSSQYGPFKTPGLVHMRPGDRVEVEISGLGVLSNPVVADKPANYRVG
ncbi:fumarylacetoacetate hydrolase family protein [Sphingopyxis indica]|uniref:fumarylacetoacetate hydrolase family protein n=1 Tax=Sphingopyxis indica TaxID=436663 RepID=UPI00293936A3|nr:fumarylacetoacetate hydrolase family protein [Sphingopyxis indica]WOF42994.1 fumarylacetoacetate hydrolase family protein [Sphingopyxis indica]